jgi:hypothetical protein
MCQPGHCIHGPPYDTGADRSYRPTTWFLSVERLAVDEFFLG